MILSMIKKVLRRLPPKIFRIMRSTYDRWNSVVHIDRRMTHDLAEYFGVSYEQAVCLLKVGSRLNKETWNILQPKSDEEIMQYYQVNPFYIFSLSYWHMSREQRQFRREIIRFSKGWVLDYGGGVGDLSLALAQTGLSVTYVDVGGKTFDFAKWFLALRGFADILLLDATKDEERIWVRKYETIVCIDVIEHIKHPEVLIAKIASSLAERGILIITGLDSKGVNEDHPMHLAINFSPTELLNSFGLYQSEGRSWLWVKKSLRRE
jgi:SAM-dependent methyltransferase